MKKFILEIVYNEWVILLIIVFLSFVQRSLIRILFPRLIDFDTYYHLFYADFIRQHGLNFKKLDKLLIPQESLSYPWLMHYILALFPKKFVEKYLEKFLNPIIDSIFVGFIYVITYFLTNSLKIALYVAIMYIFTPLFFSVQSTGPRISSFTPRLFGEVIVSIIFIIEFLYLLKHHVSLLILSCLAGSLVFVTSKFSVQAFFFISITVALICKVFFPLLIFFVSFLLSVLMFREKVISILKNQIEHLIWYFKENLKGKMAVSKRNSLSTFLQIIKSRDFKEMYKYLFYQNTFTIILFKYPLFWLALYYVFFDNSSSLKEVELSKCFILAGFILFIFTSLKPFLFLGEAERYLIYVSFFTLFYVSRYISFLVLLMIVVYGILFQIMDIVFIRRKLDQASLSLKTQNEVINFLKNISSTKNVLTVPFHLGGWRIIYDTSHNWFYFGDFKNVGELDKILDKYPFVNLEKLPYIIDKYNIDLVLIHKRLAGEDRLKKLILPPSFVKKEINDILILEKVRQKKDV